MTKKRRVTAEELREISECYVIFRFNRCWCLHDASIFSSDDELVLQPVTNKYWFYSSIEEVLINSAIMSPCKRVLGIDGQNKKVVGADGETFFLEFAYPFNINVFKHEVEVFEVMA